MIKDLGERFYASRSWRFQLARYLTIGGVSACIDLGIFVLLVAARVPILVVASVSYGFGLAVHFTLNKYLNFRRHDRPIHRQASTYALVACACWLVTLVIVKLATVSGFTPLAGKVTAIALCAPIGFFGHRHFTFGAITKR